MVRSCGLGNTTDAAGSSRGPSRPTSSSCGTGPSVQDRHASEAHSAGIKELIQVREGQVILDVSDQSITLNAGDAVSFPGDVTHAYANPGAEPAAFVLAVFEPGVGSTTTEVSHG